MIYIFAIHIPLRLFIGINEELGPIHIICPLVTRFVLKRFLLYYWDIAYIKPF